MDTLLLTIIAVIWLGGAILRAYRQARFFQIEEYMSGRYLRWLFAERERWLPNRPALAWALSSVIGGILSEAPTNLFIALIHASGAVVASLPPDEGEVKKAFNRTPRATRLLATTFTLLALATLALLLVLNGLPIQSIPELRFAAQGFAGLLVLLCAPLALVLGNLLMTPVEAAIRQRYVRQARAVLAQVHTTNIGITGSYGKTTTKTILAHLLSARYKVLPTPKKSFNTLMGVTRVVNTTLAQDFSYDYFIVEMGAYIPGEIRRLCDLTHPQIGIEIEVGPQHLERFGSLENTAKAKYELIAALPPDGLGVFNWDNPYVREMYERGYPQHRIAVSRVADPAQVPADGPRLIASDISETLAGLQFTLHDRQSDQQVAIITPLLGEHNVTNILLAAAVALNAGVSLPEIARRARTLQPAESRLVTQTTPQGITIINDAYSANPVGVVSALRVLGMHTTGRRLLITPGMVELGPLMERENQKLGEIAAAYASDVILIDAERTQPIYNGLIGAGFPPERIQSMPTLGEAVTWYQQHLQPGDTVLFLNDLPDTY